MLAQKVPAKVVQSILGHSSYHLTMDTYTHILPSLQEEAAAAQARILES
jgi:integrase